MAKMSTEEMLDAFKEMSLLELSEFVKAFEETFEVTAAAPVAVAAANAGVTAFDGQLVGPTALAFVHGDAVTVAKALRDFAKANPLLVVKSGVLDGVALTADEVKKLADLESREVLLAKAAGMFKASMYKAAYLFNAPLAQAARAVDALRQKQESAN